MNSMDELKPCPFCGNKDAFVESMQVRKGYEANIQCNGCLASIHIITFDGEEEAIKQVCEDWNRREYHE